MAHDDGAAALSEELRIAVWVMSRRMRTRVQEATDLPQAQQSVLALLDEHPGQTGAELARTEAVRPQSMNKTVSALRAAGLVSASPSPEDGRRQELSLTDAGRDVLANVRSLRGDWLTARIEQETDDDDRAALRRAAHLLRRLAAE